jgi:hypothetical protein
MDNGLPHRFELLVSVTAVGGKLMAREVHRLLRENFPGNQWVYDSSAGYFGNILLEKCVLTVMVIFNVSVR